MRKGRFESIRRLLYACGAMAVLVWSAAMGAAPADKFDNFRMREGKPIELRQVAPDLYFLYDDLSSNSAFLVTNDGVLDRVSVTLSISTCTSRQSSSCTFGTWFSFHGRRASPLPKPRRVRCHDATARRGAEALTGTAGAVGRVRSGMCGRDD